MLLIELGLVILAVVIALLRPMSGSRFFHWIEGHFGTLAARKGLSVVVIGLLALTIRAALLPVVPIPEPIVHDEFGYLLASDTFAHGRVTNPSHPMWMHFETFSVIQQPTYQCYGPPLQGLVLAAGKVFLGDPYWGVWLSVGIMCSSICWMLQAWLPANWALLGGFIAVLRLGTLTYWSNSYWGGALGAIGGALVLGALPRIKQSRKSTSAYVMAVGLAILANNRPYEGLILSLPVALALLFWMIRKDGPSISTSLRRVVAPICIVLIPVLIAMAYYNWRVTGSPMRMAYQVEQANYGVVPYMVWQSPRPQPTYRHEIIRKMYTDDLPQAYDVARSIAGPLGKAIWVWLFYVGPVLTLPLALAFFFLPYEFSLRELQLDSKFLIATMGVFMIGLMLEVFHAPHYASPAAGLIVALILLFMRRLRTWRVGAKSAGLFLSRAIPAICVVMFVLRVFAGALHLPVPESYAPAWFQEGPTSFGRERVVADLEKLPGKQLVLIRYNSTHEPFEEWVYNEANIDSAKVVWAHAMNPSDDAQLIGYFSDRQVLLLQPDETPARLTPYNWANATDDHSAISQQRAER